jgi:hypothetical protein
MKKGLLSILTIIGFSVASLAQDQVEIYLLGGTTDYSSGGVYQQTVTAPGEVTNDFEVKNISGSTKTWKITRYRINGIATWSDYMCWDLCFTAGAMSTNPWTSSTTRTIDDQSNSVLNTYVTPDENNPGTVTYRYYVSEDGINYVDSVDLEVTFALNVAAITPEVSISVGPNPASDYIMIKANGSEGGSIRIVDVLGNVVLSEPFANSKKINVANFRNGIYFVVVQPDNGKAINKKIVVRH